jgi:hypothetical protein
VIGTRKAGTTWLYENFRKNPGVVVSDKVKESGFFTGKSNLEAGDYEALLPTDQKGYAVEVDASVCYSDQAPSAIHRYNPKMNIVLIFRSPVGYLESRHTHSLRKGELSQASAAEALAKNQWLRNELDYSGILNRFSEPDNNGQLTVLPYELLKSDPHKFYDLVLQGLGVTNNQHQPFVNPVNVARSSAVPFLSAMFSNAAKLARKFGAHRIVNLAKSFGVHSALERELTPEQQTGPDLLDAIDAYAAGANAFHRELMRKTGLEKDD